MINTEFKTLFDSVNSLKQRMRNCQSETEWKNLKTEYKVILATATEIYSKYSTEEKLKEFRNRENSTISSIFQKVKRRWNNTNSDLEETVVGTEKQYVLYDDNKYDEDLANEMRYWQTELFPMAVENKLAMYEIEALYNQHLQEQYWNQQKMTCNPNIDLRNELRIHWRLYKQENDYGNVTAEDVDKIGNTDQEQKQPKSNSDEDMLF